MPMPYEYRTVTLERLYELTKYFVSQTKKPRFRGFLRSELAFIERQTGVCLPCLARKLVDPQDSFITSQESHSDDIPVTVLK
jgi:hypothetical protein